MLELGVLDRCPVFLGLLVCLGLSDRCVAASFGLCHIRLSSFGLLDRVDSGLEQIISGLCDPENGDSVVSKEELRGFRAKSLVGL
jgi:hypothetical protein